MDTHLEDATVAVFGAAQGIGRAIAEAFQAEGAYVLAVDRQPVVEVRPASEARQPKFPLRVAQVDVTDFVAVQQCVAALIAARGRCDHLVFAVGCGSGKYGYPFWALEPGDWDQVWRVNLMGAVHVAHALAPRMVEQRQGSMVFLVSVAGQIGSQTDPPYSAAKAALINFMQCAAKDLGPHGIRVNAISPGMVRTSLNQSVWQAWCDRQTSPRRPSYDEWAAEKISRVSPLGRWQTADEVAALAVFLASPHAASITGQTLNVDGGQVMHA